MDGAKSDRCDPPLRFKVSSLPPDFLIEYEVADRGQMPTLKQCVEPRG